MAEENTARQRFPYGRSNPSLEPAARAPEMDPLTELARLIGQTNPFGDQPAPARSNGQAWPGVPQAQAPGHAQPQAAAYQDSQAADPYQNQYTAPPSAQ